MDIIISHLNFNSKHYGVCKFTLKLIPLVTISNLFSLEVVPKCQHCQLCVLWKNASILSRPHCHLAYVKETHMTNYSKIQSGCRDFQSLDKSLFKV